jgi:hypothetical protein
MNVWIDCDKERRPLYPEDSPIPLAVEGDELLEASMSILISTVPNSSN